MFEIQFRVELTAWPDIEDLLNRLGAISITEADGDRDQFGEPGIINPSTWQHFLITALFEASVDPDLIRAALVHQHPDLKPQMVPVKNGDWSERWKDYWQPQAYAGGLWVCPSWCEVPESAVHIVQIDPGQAFGTGTHESTTLCMNWLASAPIKGLRVIDYGTGSGVLAIAAVKLGAQHVSAVDIDPAALVVARENATLNDCAAQIVVVEPDALNKQPVDLLVANILLEPLLNLASQFCELLKPGGQIVLAGLLESQVVQLIDTYASAFSFEPPQQLNGWALLVGRRL